MTRRSVRAAIVGLGAMGAGGASGDNIGATTLQSHATALAAMPDVELVGVADVSDAARARFHAAWDERWPGVRSYDDHRALLEHGAVDLLTVATPDHLHGRILLDAIEARVPHVFAEKPLVTDLEEADAILAAAERAGTCIQVNYTRRFRPQFRAARAEIEAGAIGPLSLILVRNGGPRAMLFRNTTHFIDLACYFAATEPCWVTADFDEGFEGYGLAYAGDGGTDARREPGANIYVAFEGTVRAFVSDRKSADREQSILLIGRSGSISLLSDGLVIRSQTPSGEHVERKVPATAGVAPIQAAIDDLIGAGGNARALISPAAEARKDVAIVAAALASQAAGNARVEVRPAAWSSVECGIGRSSGAA